MVFGANLNVSDADSAGQFAVMVSTNGNRTAENQDNPGTWHTLALAGLSQDGADAVSAVL